MHSPLNSQCVLRFAIHRLFSQALKHRTKYSFAIVQTRCLFSPLQVNEITLKNLSDDREAMKHSIRGLRAKIEGLAGERERAEKDSLENTRSWQERAEELKAQGVQVMIRHLFRMAHPALEQAQH